MRDTLGSCPVGSSGRACCQCCHSHGTSECRGMGGACSAASTLVVLFGLCEAGWAFDVHLLWLQRWLFPSNISCDASLPLSTPLPPPPPVACALSAVWVTPVLRRHCLCATRRGPGSRSSSWHDWQQQRLRQEVRPMRWPWLTLSGFSFVAANRGCARVHDRLCCLGCKAAL